MTGLREVSYGPILTVSTRGHDRGYTYDWAESSGEYGLTEFLVREGAEVTVAYTYAIPDYIARLEQAGH